MSLNTNQEALKSKKPTMNPELLKNMSWINDDSNKRVMQPSQKSSSMARVRSRSESKDTKAALLDTQLSKIYEVNLCKK